MIDLISNTLSHLGSLASLVGLVLTVWVLKSVSDLQSFYIAKARISVLLQIISHDASMLSEAIIAPVDPQKIKELLIHLRVHLESLEKKMPRSERRRIRDLTLRIGQSVNASLSEHRIRYLYLEIQYILESANTFLDDLDWSKP